MTRAWFVVVIGCAVALAACSRKDTGASQGEAGRNLSIAPAAASAAAEGRRIALVVGNSRYESAPLTNPVNDAELIAMSLMQVGFEVRLVTDGDQRAMKRAIQAFGETLEAAGPAAVGLFYYAGHGVQLGGRNYLIPVGAAIERDADVDIEAVSADWVIEQMRFARNRLNFVILDACRNNPFARSFRSGDRGLAKMDAPAGVLIAYSTAPGDVAADGTGRNSPYSEALAGAMRDSSEPAELMFKRVRDQVRRSTTEKQTPWESSSLTGDNFYFALHAVPPPVVGGAPTRESAPAAATAPLPAQPEPRSEPAPARPTSASAGTAATEILPPLEQTPSQMVMSSQFDPSTAPGDLCTRAPGDWLADSENTPGTIRLDANRRGVPSLKFRKPAKILSWSCDAANRRVVVRFDNGSEHTLTLDYIERWLFGSDEDGNAISYTRQR